MAFAENRAKIRRAGGGVSKLLEDDVRDDPDRIVASAQEAGEGVVRPRRHGRWGARIIGSTLVGGGAAGLLIYPGTRKPIRPRRSSA